MNCNSGIYLHIHFFVKERWYFMLVLTRKVGEEFVIDGNIRVKIIDFRGKKVRIGVQAPKQVRIRRSKIQNTLEDFSYPLAN
jgi:carbon storage regulator